MNKNQLEQKAILLTIPSVLLIIFIYMLLFLQLNLPLRIFPQLENRINLLFFFSSCVLCVFLAVVLYHIYFFLLNKIDIQLNPRHKSKISRTIFWLFLIVFTIVFSFERFENDFDSHYHPWHYSKQLTLMTVVVGVLLANGYPYLEHLFRWLEKTPLKSKLIVIFYVFIALLAAIATYRPNIFGSFYASHHFNAYFHSIYRVMQFEPYSDINGGVYGFYGILLAPLVQLLGGSYHACIVVLCGVSGVCVLCYCYVIHYYAKDLWLRLLGSTLLLSGWATSSGIYVQLFPHRILFCAISMALLVYFRKNDISDKYKNTLTLLISTLAILWNLETGIACAFGMFICLSMRQLRTSTTFVHMVKVTCRQMLLSLLSIPMAVVLVNLYTLAAGGEFLNLKGLLFPYVETTYVNDLSWDLIRVPAVWMLVLGSILIAICYGIYHTPLCRSNIPESNAPEYVACAAMMAVQMTYYVNRAVYGNLYIVFPHMILLLIFAYVELDEFQHGEDLFEKFLSKDLRSIIAMVLVCLTFMVSVKYNYTQKKQEQYQDLTEYDTFCQEFINVVPEDTLCIGAGADELYSSLGWDTKYYGLDFPDISFSSPKGIESLRTLMLETDNIVLVYEKTHSDESTFREWGIWEDFIDRFQEVQVLSYQNTQFAYYTAIQ